MADYAPLLTRAVAALPDNTVAARKAIYDRAREALVKQLRAMDPPLEEAAIDSELLGLETAIDAIEATHVKPSVDDELLAALEASVNAKDVGPKVVHEAAVAAESLGTSVGEAKRTAEEALSALNESEGEPVVSAPEPAARIMPPPVDFPVRAPVYPPPEGSGEERRGGAGRWIAAGLVIVALMAGGGGGAYWWTTRPVAPAPERAPVAAEPVDRSAKVEDRIQAEPSPPPAGASGQAEPVTPAPAPVQPAPAETVTPAAPAAPRAGVSRAVLLEETPGSQQGVPLNGTVIWRTETVNPGPGLPAEIALRADIEIPDRRFGLTLLIRPNSDSTLPASHTVELLFRLPRDFPYGGVANVPGMLSKPSEQARGLPLAGQSVRVTNGFFLIGLSSQEDDRANNIASLKERGWFDLPIMYDNGRRAILTIEKGESGNRAFTEAFAAWRQ